MKVLKSLAFLSIISMALGAFADAANVLVSFSSVGPDKYADGTTVLDGEWYALVWSADGNFEGINVDCTPVDANDKVVLVASLAKGGRCPYTVFQIDSQSSDAKSTGVYAVYLLDTRNAEKTAVAANADGRPAEVNAAVISTAYEAKAATSGGVVSKADANGTWAESGVEVAEFKQPRISSFKVEGAVVKITVVDMMPGVKYNVKMGSEVGNLATYGLVTPKTASDNGVDFTINKSDAKFFKVVREPLAK